MPGNSVHFAGDESLSPRVQERGSLRTSGDGRSQFIGSSSGIYFVNTVRRAFADADVRLSSVLADDVNPSPEDCIVDDEDEGIQAGPNATRRPGQASAVPSRHLSPDPAAPRYGAGSPAELGLPPPRDVAKELFMTYFQTWHRFFPFLHGPTVAKDIESLYANTDELPSDTAANQSTGDQRPLPLARVIILQCLFNLASLHGDTELPSASRIDGPARVLPCLIGLAAKGDIISIQALFAAQLLLVARMSLRTAVVVAGLLSRSIFLAGLHRCPVRYPELSAEDCDIRKRLFWSVYVVDRFLSQALGHPLGIQDSDIDVCSLAGPELHHRPFPASEPAVQRGHSNQNSPSSPRRHSERQQPALQHFGSRHDRHLILASQVDYSRLLGRALELFHKSLHIRSINSDTVLSLRTDLNAWWNSLPCELQDFSVPPENSTLHENRGQPWSAPAFFILLNKQLRLLIHRPWLSLEPSSAEFQSALQTCIELSRDIILTMKKLRSAGYALFWPGHLSAVWMAGIIIAFACQLHLHPAEKGQSEIAMCLDVLAAISHCWPLARNCRAVLSELQQTLQQNKNRRPDGSLMETTLPRTSTSSEFTNRQFLRDPRNPSPQHLRTPKRRRIYSDVETNQTPDSTNSRYQRNANQSEFRRPTTQLPSSGPGGIDGSTGRLAPMANENWQTTRAPTFEEYGQSQNQQGQNEPTTQQAPMTTPEIRGLDVTGYPDLRPEDDYTQWVNAPSMGNWNGGMPDILGGATWESLIHAINDNDIGWDGDLGFLG
ncbi:putative transcriptional regulatory protein [Paramyrothecium foliicola]|nr:putative transcriptional regulatory protein [Paramyrothecium foliicola]